MREAGVHGASALEDTPGKGDIDSEACPGDGYGDSGNVGFVAGEEAVINAEKDDESARKWTAADTETKEYGSTALARRLRLRRITVVSAFGPPYGRST